MRVLVTGGAGYVGSVTVRYLLDQGIGVSVLDTMERGHRSAVDARAAVVAGDVGDAVACAEALNGCDAVIHCAGYAQVAESVRSPEMYFDNNVRRPLVLLDVMARAGVCDLVFSSSAAVYGEPAEAPIEESAVLAPLSPYGESKLAFEREAEARAAEGLRSVFLRYFNASGAWPDGSMGEAHEPETHLIPRVMAALAGGDAEFEVFGDDYPTADGTCVRDYVHVCDLAQAHLRALEHLGAGGEGGAFNLGSGVGCSNREVVDVCAAAAGREIAVRTGPRRPGDPAVLVASSTRAREVLGWCPERGGLSVIAQDAWRWHSAHPDGYPAA